jgi:putative hemin transport protein
MDESNGVATTEGGAAPTVEEIRAYFAPDRSRMTMMAARKLGVPERTVLDALVGFWPVVRLRPGAFRPLVEALGELGPMRVFVRSKAAVMETVGTFGGLSETGPFLNVQTDTLDMHIFHDEIAAVYSVEKTGHDTTFATHSFQFFDRRGDSAFKAFLWDNFPDVPAHRVEHFRELTRRFSEEIERP